MDACWLDNSFCVEANQTTPRLISSWLMVVDTSQIIEVNEIMDENNKLIRKEVIERRNDTELIEVIISATALKAVVTLLIALRLFIWYSYKNEYLDSKHALNETEDCQTSWTSLFVIILVRNKL